MIAVIAVVGGDDEVAAARRALAAATAPLAFFEGAAIETWVSATGRTGAAWVRSVGSTTVPESTWTSPTSAAFVLGQPIRWRDGRADGEGALDAERLASVEPPALAEELDGRGLLLALGDDGFTVVGDPMHAYPLYLLEDAPALSRSRSGGVWVTNLPGALRQPGPAASALVLPRIASAVAYGSSFDGAPWLAGVRRIGGWRPSHRLPAAVAFHTAAPRLDRLAGFHGRGDIHPVEAGELLVEVARAMARPGADLIVPISAGKDSRLILAAALAAGLPVRAVTGGADGSADVERGRALAEASGVPHQQLSADQPTRSSHPLPTITLTSRVSAGVVTAGDAHFFPHGPSELPGIWLSGQAGEIARAFYGRPLGPATAPVVLLKAMSRRPRRPLPLTASAELQMAWAVRQRLRALRRAGAGPAALGDLFYLTDRMGRHLSGALLHFELGLDYASPLWSRRLLPHLWAGTTAQRRTSTFHDQVTAALAEALPGATRGAFHDAIRADGAAKEDPVEPGGRADEALSTAQAHLRALASAVPTGEPLWDALSRARTLTLAETPAEQLDFIERQHVWRLATALESWTS